MWLEGLDATSHKIYFGTNPGSLVYQGEQTSNIFDPGALAVDDSFIAHPALRYRVCAQ